MFFAASKVLWFLAAPMNLLLFVALIGVALCWGSHARLGRMVAAVAVGLLILICIAPLGAWIIAPLEDRFPPPSAELAAPYGIIVLGGAIDAELGQARGEVILADAGSRITEAASLARRFPGARLVFSGGSGSLMSGDPPEAEEAGKLFAALGIDPGRIVLEDRSRNTQENAQFTRDMVHPEPSQSWLLVTSAYHMPRSMGLFRKAGFHVTAYPVDYRSFGGGGDWRVNHETWRNLRRFDLAVHEWVGLVAYRLSGKIDSFFPAP
jgi:uncharacterized SAM-binding protein YcdF (DUF218 family)